VRPFRKFARQANQFSGVPSKRRLSVETLEDRRLLAVVGYEPGSPTESALISFYGDDLTGKDGPLAPVGIELSLLFHEYNDFISGGAQGQFTPSNSGLMVNGNMVTVRGIAAGDTSVLMAQLEAIGIQNADSFESLVIGQLPIDKIDEMAALSELRIGSSQLAPITRAGVVTSQGDPAMLSDVGRATFGVDGSGIMIGVMSDSYDAFGDAAIDIANGDLPANGVLVLADAPFIPFFSEVTDEGRAMLQIIHDVAPGADLAYHTATNGPIDFASGIGDLARAGSDIIVDDIGYPGEPWFQDGVVAQAAADVVRSGVAYFSAAGNESDTSYESPFANSGIAGPLSGGMLHDFDPGPAIDTLQEITIPVFSTFEITFQWDQPFGSLGGSGSRSDVDVLLLSADGLVDVTPTEGKNNNIGGDAMEFSVFFNDGTYDFDGDGTPDETFNLSFELATGGPAPGLMKYISFGEETVEEYLTGSSTSYGHPNADGVGAVGAAAYWDTPVFGATDPLLEDFSSLGGLPILFDTNGTRLAAPEVRTNVSVTGPDNANTTFFFFGDDGDSDGIPNFPGTSAAAPHVAAVAALMLEGAGGPNSLSPAEILAALESTAIDITELNDGRIIPNGNGYDLWSGAGFVDALAAIGATFNSGGSGAIAGTISGTVFNDLSSDGVFDAGEPGIAGVYVYADVDNNGKIGIGEPTGVSNAAGRYTITGVPMGSAIIREVVSPGFTPTFPVEPDYHPIEVEFDALDVVGVDFGNRAAVDYGDAPAPYPTLAAAGGASHNIWPGLFLGAFVDGELNGIPDPQALGDDNAEDPFAGDTQLSGDDEDGVTFTTAITAGQQATIDVVASKNGILQGWIDFNGDGDWSDAGEQIVVDRALDPGTNRLSYAVPSGAVSGQTYARFRFSFERGLSYNGATYAGEVEDYAVTIGGVAPAASPEPPPTQQDLANEGSPVIVRDSFQNSSNRFDIDNNGVVNSLDLVILLRDNASYNNRILHSTSQVTRGMFVDVNNDNISNPLDIVQLLRELNRLAAAAEDLPEGEADYGDSMVVSMPNAVTTPILADFVISSEWEMVTPALPQDDFDHRVSTSMTSQAAAPQPSSSAATFVDLSSDGMTELLEPADDDSDMAEADIDQLFEDFAADVASQWLLDCWA